MSKQKADARAFGQDLMRGEHLVGNASGLGGQESSGTSIFDPVLCELAYRWFCPAGGSVLDPFAGGSVRGIVAAVLGLSYTGIDLRPEQVAANEAQWADIGGRAVADMDGPRRVKVSAASARLRFHGCDPDYIRDVCHASCCQSSTAPSGIMVTIHPSEQAAIEARGAVVRDGLLQPREGEKRCPFKTSADLCGLHGTSDKPFGCIASPFTLNRNGTLIVRNRYKSLKCYDDGPRLPAYKAFRASLDLIFGPAEAARVCDHLDAGGGDIAATIGPDAYRLLVENDAIKHGVVPGDATSSPPPRWIVGDSADCATLAGPGPYDFVFSCPPYADLERYSDDPRDLSTMDYAAFVAAYRGIVAAAVGLLAPDRFACVVVGDVRDRKGFYRNFVGDTVAAFQDAGATLYNEAILVTMVGSLPIRVGKQFAGARKLGKTHQNVLVFFKGDPRRIGDAFGEVPPGAFGLDGELATDSDGERG